MEIQLKVSRRRAMGVVVTDGDGNVASFDSVKDAARVLGCTVQHVYLGIRTGRLVSGCKVEAERR